MDRDDDDCGVLDNLDISNNGKQNIFLKVSLSEDEQKQMLVILAAVVFSNEHEREK